MMVLSRAPPKRTATVLLMSRTIAVGFAVLCPWIATLPTPVPHIVTLSNCILGFVASRFLSPPGSFSENKDDGQAIDNYSKFSTSPVSISGSFKMLTFTEKTNSNHKRERSKSEGISLTETTQTDDKI